MTDIKKQGGFSVVELLITLLIASLFLITGYLLYSVVIKDGGESRQQSLANNATDDYLQQYRSKVTNPCTVQTPATLNPTISGLSNVSVDISITCPYGLTSTISKLVVTLTYGTNAQKVKNGTFVKPACINGFISVPGSETYGTNDFCVMKYEAKYSGVADTPISKKEDTPWDDFTITKQKAVSISQKVVGCPGCHLITEAEWLTIAQNVASVPSNWSSGIVGNGYIYSGLSDNSPSFKQVASDDSDDGYYLTGDNANDVGVTCGRVGKSQRRTLTLTNNEVIWDFSGNVNEWIDTSVNSGQPGVLGSGAGWRDWTAASLTSHGSLSPDPHPSSNAITGSENWDSSYGIGKIYSNADTTAEMLVVRGGAAYDTVQSAGIYSMYIYNFGGGNGFRAAQ